MRALEHEELPREPVLTLQKALSKLSEYFGKTDESPYYPLVV
jgi:hypothetical protein